MVIENGGIMILECTSRKKWNMFCKFLDLVKKWLRIWIAIDTWNLLCILMICAITKRESNQHKCIATKHGGERARGKVIKKQEILKN